MNKHRVALTCFGLALALLGVGFAGCRGDGPGAEGIDSPALAAQGLDGECIDFRGFTHCPLGDAHLTKSDNGEALEVSNLSAADKDGIAILLPEVTQFSATGEVKFEDDKSTLVARALSEGVSTSTMTLQAGTDGYAVSATFTGDGDASTYSVKLYADDLLVQSIANVPSGGGGALMLEQPTCYVDGMQVSWWECRMYLQMAQFGVIQSGSNTGACVWTLVARDGGEMAVRMEDGKTIIADRIELEEEVPASGSYPYLTFNRIDYTANGGTITLENETVK